MTLCTEKTDQYLLQKVKEGRKTSHLAQRHAKELRGSEGSNSQEEQVRVLLQTAQERVLNV